MTIYIYADFNTQDEQGRVDLGLWSSLRDIARLKEPLYPGMHVVLYFDDVEVDAILEYDHTHTRWVGHVPDWRAYRER
jgi:hypothetical protein